MIARRTGGPWAAKALCHAALLLTAGPLAAQTPAAPTPAAPAPPPESNPEIVVVGRDMPDIATVRKLARAITPSEGFDRPIARFADPVCVVAQGLPKSLLAELADRLLADATEAGIRLGGAGCTPNVAVLFVDDAKTALRDLRRTRSDLFGEISVRDIEETMAAPGPAYALTHAALRSRDGDRPYDHPDLPAPVLRVSAQSNVVLPIRRDIVSAVIVIERAALRGLTIPQVADYAAMRAFAAVRPERAAGGDTILTLFTPDAPRAPEMTPFDRGYLKALYTGSANQYPTAKIAGIARLVTRSSQPDEKRK